MQRTDLTRSLDQLRAQSANSAIRGTGNLFLLSPAVLPRHHHHHHPLLFGIRALMSYLARPFWSRLSLTFTKVLPLVTALLRIVCDFDSLDPGLNYWGFQRLVLRSESRIC